ncbi:hypothetical protein GCM10011520_16800 [Shewanella carassii]|uniref:Uncharacterized protein n=1 Tax=Shewanella carassii TaxID=1987584 RepID=A0ABQ1T0T8_9GAMM|nr:hypothetical protein GCM10011520_16800 [Shewanella carassii]
MAKLSLQIMIIFLPYTRVGYERRRTKGLCNIGWAVFWGFTKRGESPTFPVACSCLK